MRTEQELRDRVADLERRLEKPLAKYRRDYLTAQIIALEWALGKEPA